MELVGRQRTWIRDSRGRLDEEAALNAALLQTAH